MYNEEANRGPAQRREKNGGDRTLRFLRNFVFVLIGVLVCLVVEYNNSTPKQGVVYSHETEEGTAGDSFFADDTDDDGTDADEAATPQATKAMDHELQKMNPHVH